MKSNTDSDLLKYISAFQLAVSKHDEARQTREDNSTPYWVHPLRVVERLRLVGISDYDVLSAAILHDVVEDTDVTLDDLTKQFGEHISLMVAEVTHKPDDSLGTYIEQLSKSSADGQAIKLADKWDNINELRRMKYPSYGGRPPLQYINEAVGVLDACVVGNSELAELLKEEIELAKKSFGS